MENKTNTENCKSFKWIAVLVSQSKRYGESENESQRYFCYITLCSHLSFCFHVTELPPSHDGAFDIFEDRTHTHIEGEREIQSNTFSCAV